MMRSLEEPIAKLAEPALEPAGLRVVDLEINRQGSRLWVRIFVERRDLSQGGVTVDELGEANHALGRALDEADLVPESYLLEVSSPGVNRRIRWLADFERAVGQTITVTVRDLVGGRRKFRGKLTAAGEEGITVSEDGKNFLVPLNSIDRANLEYNFEARTENQG